jgi:hypothetical protein
MSKVTTAQPPSPRATSPIFSPAVSPDLHARGAPEELLPADLDDFTLDDDEAANIRLELGVVGPLGAQLPQTDATDRLVADTRHALRRGGDFTHLADNAVNGAYLLSDRNGLGVAVFKPQDEEAHSLSLMAGRGSVLAESIQRGCRPGEGARREYMAYMLDQQSPKAFRAGVPPTTLVTLAHPYFGRNKVKTGSLQKFVPSRGASEDFGASTFSASSVHKLALFDLRTLNLDRHGGNMLVGLDGATLVPIDHGYALPSALGEPWLDWRLWPQAATGLGTLDAPTARYVQGLDPLAAAPLAQLLGLGDGVWRTVAVMTLLLQAAVSRGASLREMADLTMRPPPKAVSNSGGASGREEEEEEEEELSPVERIAQELVVADEAAAEIEDYDWPWPQATEGTWLDRASELITAQA